jgi:hypothetical protein
MLLYATVIPYSTIESENYDISEEALKVVINCVEIFFMTIALQNKSNFIEGKESHLKVLTVALSWSLAENIFSYFLYFVANATSDEFKWEYIQTAIIANIDLIERIGIVALVESYRILKDNGKFNLHLIFFLILKYGLNSIGSKYISFLSGDNWTIIQGRLVLGLIFCIIAKVIFNQVSSTEEQTKKTN